VFPFVVVIVAIFTFGMPQTSKPLAMGFCYMELNIVWVATRFFLAVFLYISAGPAHLCYWRSLHAVVDCWLLVTGCLLMVSEWGAGSQLFQSGLSPA
jgi:hypothetical protein